MSDEQDLTQNELDNLKVRADRLGVKYHPSIGAEKLREKIAEAMAENPGEDQNQAPDPEPEPKAPTVEAAAPAAPVEETLAMKRKRLRNEALKLIRIRVTCMNPAKKDWEGEIITTGNALVGTISKYIPFNADQGWHVPYMLYLQLKDRQCQTFVNDKSKAGVTVRKGKLIKEFAIELMDPLTSDELKDLAQRQALAGSVG